MQLVKGIRYTITVELSNTLCKKSAMVRTCDFYPETQKLKVGFGFSRSPVNVLVKCLLPL